MSAIMAGMILTCFVITAQTDSFVVKLWADGPAVSNELTEKEHVAANGHITNVSNPDITIFPANKNKNTGIAVLICPGGGYSRLASRHEGVQFAEWFAENGITGIVLKYRMPNGHHSIPLEDAKRAMQVVRENASLWNIDPHKVGVIGFSAGGHLASTLLTHFDSSSRPDFGVLFYPVISFKPDLTHGGSVSNLLGDEITDSLIDYYSNDLQVNSDTPPTLLFHSNDDTVVDPENSILFYESLRKHKVPTSLHIFPNGVHGWGFNSSFSYHHVMKEILLTWIHELENK
jgi:acetyl esterase/lipase